MQPLELKRFDKIIALRTGEGRVVGFHTHNLQVAELDPALWETLSEADAVTAAADIKSSLQNEMRAELLEWNQETDPAVTDAHVPQKVP